MNEDPLKLAQLKEAPMKTLEDLFTSEKQDSLITVEKKVVLVIIHNTRQLLYLLYLLNFRLTLVA